MSNLLSQASLVMIPSGYKEDVVYSAIPTNGNGDLSFTRASNGTRVNSAGLVEDCPWNLCEYSEDQTQWTSQNATTVTANSTTAPNGTLTADTVTPTAVNDDHYRGIGLSSQVGALTAFIYVKPNGYNFFDFGIYNGSTYLVRATFDLVNLTYTFTIAGTATIESVGNGWLKCGISGTNASLTNIGVYYRIRPTDGAGVFTGNGTSGAFIWGAQFNIGATAKPYFPTTDRLNVPRLTYQNGGGGCPSLLLEKQSTNLLSYSQDFTNAYWSKLGQGIADTAVVTANYAISPDGTQNATRFVCNLNGSSSAADRSWMIGTFSGQATSTLSIWIKLNSAGTKTIIFSDGGGDITTISGTDWQRIDGTFVGAGGEYRIGLIGGTGSSDTLDCSIWGAQAESGSYPTSYIPTTSSSATRVADVCSKTGISSLFGTNQGTFFIDFLYLNSVPFDYLFDVTDSINNERFLMYSPTGNDIYTFYDSQNSGFATYQLTKGQRYKIGVKYNSSGTVWYVNGVLSATGTVSFAYQMAQIYLGQRYSLVQQTQMQVNQSIVFPTALSGTDLIALTTI